MISGVGALDPGMFKIKLGDSAGLASSDFAPTGVSAGPSFASAVSDAAARAMGTMERAEQASVQALQGGADMRDVVDAVMSAEQTLQAAVAIRDKIVTAFLDVSRMAI
jgi:flagellar hook-basal body complex protein FliE